MKSIKMTCAILALAFSFVEPARAEGIATLFGLFEPKSAPVISAPTEEALPSPRKHATRGRRAHRIEASASASSLRASIAHHAAANGVPFKLADAIVRIESGYRPSASNGGAIGLMQIKPATARGVGFAGSAHELYGAETNLRYGMRYLAQVYRMSHGDTCQTVMRYQSGAYARRINAANRAYCAKARSIMASN